MLDEVVKVLICPHCGGDLRENGGSLICSNGHTNNVARQGYVSLLGRYAGTHTADSAEMIAARGRFLDGGHFSPITDAIREEATALDGGPEGVIVDLGAGTGYYLSAALDAAPGRHGLAIDNSKFAARRAAKAHPRAGAVVADIWDELPLKDESAAMIINVFAPRNGAEIERVSNLGCTLLIVTPKQDHLRELIEPFSMIGVDPDKQARLERSLEAVDIEFEGSDIDWKMELDRDAVRDLVGMGPSAGRLPEDELSAKLASLDEVTEVTGSVRLSIA